MYNLENNPPPVGLVQTRGEGETITSLHDLETGWPIQTYAPPADIFLQDDLTFKNGKIIELEKYIDYYGDKIDQVTFYVWHKHLKEIYPNLNFVCFPKFHYEQRQGIERLNVADDFSFSPEKEFVFLCLNMNRRRHRDKVVALLQNMPSRLISYKAVGWNVPDHNDWDPIDYNQGLAATGNNANLKQLQPVYDRCQFSVVTETRYNLPYDFITEKTTQCFVALHPALYVSNRGHVQEIRNLGFDVFDDVFDHSYDTVEDDKRIEHMIESNRSVLENGIPDYGDLKDRLLENRRRYLDPNCPLYEVK